MTHVNCRLTAKNRDQLRQSSAGYIYLSTVVVMEAFKLLSLTDVDSVEDIFRGLVGEVEVDRCLRAVDLY